MKTDVAPPGREAQVQALKKKPDIDNPWAVSWASYNADGYDSPYSGGRCDSCGQTVPVEDGALVSHVAGKGRNLGHLGGPVGHVDDYPDGDPMRACPGGGASYQGDAVPSKGGSWVVMSKADGRMAARYKTRGEAEQDAASRVRTDGSRSGTRVRRFERFDLRGAELASPVQTPEGFWRVEGKVARTGIQEYRDSAGGLRRELRMPDDVRESVPTFALQPLTNDHPDDLLTPQTARDHVAGAVGDARYNADGWVTAPLTVWTADAIGALRAGRAQLSVGYSCEMVDEAGEWQGQRYDARQTKIQVNHVALVDVARAGPQARVRLDAGDAEAAVFVSADGGMLASTKSEDRPMPHKFKLDGYEIEVSGANDETLITRIVAGIRKDGEDKVAAEKRRADDAEKARADAQAKLDAREAQAKLDAAKTVPCPECGGAAKIGEAKCDGCEGAGKVALLKFDEAAWREPMMARVVGRRVHDRAALVVEARRHLGENEKLDGLSDLAIKKLVIQRLDESHQEGKENAGKLADEGYVRYRYDFAIESAGKQRGAQVVRLTDEQLRRANVDQIDQPSDDPLEAMRRMDARTLAANRETQTHGRSRK